MSSNPKKPEPSWKALAGASKVTVDEPAVNGEHPQASTAKPAPAPHAVINREAQTSRWPQLSVRVHPGQKEAYVLMVEAKGYVGREIIAEALDDWLLKHEPVNDYTRELHERRGSATS